MVSFFCAALRPDPRFRITFGVQGTFLVSEGNLSVSLETKALLALMAPEMRLILR
jgi:hypothetical protein